MTVKVPVDWPVVVGLNPVKAATNTFAAPTYDVLADNPVTAGKSHRLVEDTDGEGELTVSDRPGRAEVCEVTAHGRSGHGSGSRVTAPSVAASGVLAFVFTVKG